MKEGDGPHLTGGRGQAGAEGGAGAGPVMGTLSQGEIESMEVKQTVMAEEEQEEETISERMRDKWSEGGGDRRSTEGDEE